MTPDELRDAAAREVAELGPQPAGPRERDLRAEERRGATLLLAALADWDPAVLRKAALTVAEDLLDPKVRQLLLDAAEAAELASP